MTLRALDRVEEGLTSTLIVAMTLLTFVQVVLRYVFNSGLVWALEASVYLFSWLLLIGLSAGVRTNSHLAVDVITKHLSPAGQRLAALVAAGLSLLYAVLMFLGSWTLVERLHGFGSLAHDLPLPRWVLLLSLPIGFALLGLRIAEAIVGLWRGTKPPSPHGDEPLRRDDPASGA
jgi:C4-dicarboxylate transporter DctQ subunit